MARENFQTEGGLTAYTAFLEFFFVLVLVHCTSTTTSTTTLVGLSFAAHTVTTVTSPTVLC
jgi:hypothetical protein